jgi:hypothetical protein
MKWLLLVAVAFSTILLQNRAVAERLECDGFLEGLPPFLRMLAPPRLCERVAFAMTEPGTFTARSTTSSPLMLPDGRSFGFVDLQGPVPSLHLLVETGWISPIDTIYLATASNDGSLQFEPSAQAETTAIEVLIDGDLLRAEAGETTASWANSPWASIVTVAQVTHLPGVSLISLVLTKEGSRVVRKDLSKGSGLQALLQWRVIHKFQGISERQSLTSEGRVSCIRNGGRTFSDADIQKIPPLLRALPIDFERLENLVACE